MTDAAEAIVPDTTAPPDAGASEVVSKAAKRRARLKACRAERTQQKLIENEQQEQILRDRLLQRHPKLWEKAQETQEGDTITEELSFEGESVLRVPGKAKNPTEGHTNVVALDSSSSLSREN